MINIIVSGSRVTEKPANTTQSVFVSALIVGARATRMIDFRVHDPNTHAVRRVASLLLLTAILFTGSGLARYLHELDHLAGRPTASVAKILGIAEVGHDESTCSICLNLHMPALANSIIASLICLGIFTAFLTQLAPRLLSQRIPARIDCRGPPRR